MTPTPIGGLRRAVMAAHSIEAPDAGKGPRAARGRKLQTPNGAANGSAMAYIITRLCRDCVDTACVAVCPVDCIYAYKGADHATFPNQLYIHPDECIDCGACEPECPWQAIFEEATVPDQFKDDTPLNYKMMEHKDQFEVSPTEKHPH